MHAYWRVQHHADPLQRGWCSTNWSTSEEEAGTSVCLSAAEALEYAATPGNLLDMLPGEAVLILLVGEESGVGSDEEPVVAPVRELGRWLLPDGMAARSAAYRALEAEAWAAEGLPPLLWLAEGGHELLLEAGLRPSPPRRVED